jgi:hypothetical protein
MTLNATQLLKRLEPAVRPVGAPPALGSPKNAASIEGQSFDQLFALASKGALNSGRQIQLQYEPTPPLSASQLERLAAAADQAEAAGAKTALMMLDGRGFVIDVQRRTLIGELSSNGSILNGIESAMFVGGTDEALFKEPLGPPAAVVPAHMISNSAKRSHSARPSSN